MRVFNIYLLISMIFSLTFYSCSDKKNIQILRDKEDEKNVNNSTDNFKKFLLKGIESGKINWILTGDSAVFLLEPRDSINIKHPNMLFYDKDDQSKVTSEVNSIEAIVNTNTKNMYAIGSVEMFSYKENASLFSEEVFYDNTSGMFYSDKKVRVERGDSITEGVGFDAKSDLSVISIKNNVSIVYKSTETI